MLRNGIGNCAAIQLRYVTAAKMAFIEIFIQMGVGNVM